MMSLTLKHTAIVKAVEEYVQQHLLQEGWFVTDVDGHVDYDHIKKNGNYGVQAYVTISNTMEELAK